MYFLFPKPKKITSNNNNNNKPFDAQTCDL